MTSMGAATTQTTQPAPLHGRDQSPYLQAGRHVAIQGGEFIMSIITPERLPGSGQQQNILGKEVSLFLLLVLLLFLFFISVIFVNLFFQTYIFSSPCLSFSFITCISTFISPIFTFSSINFSPFFPIGNLKNGKGSDNTLLSSVHRGSCIPTPTKRLRMILWAHCHL